MKLLYIVCLSVLLSGCGWFNQDEPVQENPPANEAKTNEMKDLFTYFDEQGLEYANSKDMEVVDINAHEGKAFEYQGNPVYLYRMNMQDEKIFGWMDEIKNTGKVTINQNGTDESYDALINGEYLMVTKQGTDLNKLSEVFKKYEIK